MKDLGETSYVLGIQIIHDRSKKSLALSQATYIDKIIKRFAMKNSKKGILPFRHGISLSKEQSPKTPQEVEEMGQIPYDSAIGSLMYAMLCTRPDICYAVGVVSRLQSNHGKEHWVVVRAILKYLRTTRNYMLVYGHKDLILTGYTDSDFQGDKDSRKKFKYPKLDFPHLKKFKYPKLELLILYNGYKRMKNITFPALVFPGMEEVKVLDMSRMCFPQQTTSLTHSSRNLRTLYMSHCDFEDANIIGELRNLEVLRMNFCQLKELPATMSQLTQLKVLEITNCFLLVIHPNIISSMINLEVFDVLNFSGWEEEVSCKNKLIQNAKLSEFKCLLHLTSLRLNIVHHNTLSDLLELKLQRFIVVGSCLKDSEHVERYLNLGTTNLSLINNSDMRHLIGDQHGNRRSPNYYSSIDTLVLERMESF